MAIREIKYADREEWLTLRRQLGIGGSEAGAVMGLDEYKSPYSLWAEKTGRVPEFSGNLTTKVGSYLEELIAQLFCEETGKKVRRKNRILVNGDHPWAFADVDRMVVGESALLECKSTNSLPMMKQVRGGQFPDRWYCQCMHYLMVTGFDRAYLAVLANGREFRIFTLERDEQEIQLLSAAESEFWDLVRSDTPPEPDGSAATADTLETIYAGGGGALELFGRDTLLDEYTRIKGTKKDLDARLTEIENILKNDMGNAEKAACGAYSISWKPQQRRSFDTKGFGLAHPEIDLEPFYKVSKSRPFKVTAKTERSA